ncbi:hypothetical protein BSKO_05702 [Bryopsis sp. KO-2023]|nr:hypothetical protein BSKO_05702 [Bryopsis sp. KO-2023]
MMATKLIILFVVALAAGTALANDIGTVEVTGLGDRGSCPVRPWSQQQIAKREKIIPVKFDLPYAVKPKVALFLSATDVDHRYNMRTNTEVQNLTNEGFDLKIGVWCNTYAYWLKVTYVAIADNYQ